MPIRDFTYLLNIYNLGLVMFHDISTTIGYLMPIPVFTYILDIYDLVWLLLMTYQPL